jgi:hypothetical protein
MNLEYLYLDDHSTEETINKNDCKKKVTVNESTNEENDIEKDIENENKPSFELKPDYNSRGEKVVVFSIKIPIKNNSMKIDILINEEMYKNIGKFLRKN